MRGTIATAALLAALLLPSSVLAASIQYISTGRQAPEMRITFSRNGGASWQQGAVRPGQVFNVPPDATHLTINGVPRDPKRNWKVKDGNVF